VALAPDLAVANDDLDAAVERARHELVGKPAPRQLQGRGPGEVELAAFRAVAQAVGAARAHPRRPRGARDDAAIDERDEKGPDPLGRPGGAVDRLGQAIGDARRGRSGVADRRATDAASGLARRWDVYWKDHICPAARVT
jgi:hypothetical protein